MGSILKPYLIFWAGLSMVGIEHLPGIGRTSLTRAKPMETPHEYL
jgi:hypothetical protein